jgi:hypothetical protein
LDSTSLFVGNSTGGNSAANAGTVEIFSYANNKWSQTQTLSSIAPGINGQFGISTALSSDGKTLAVGANFSNSGLKLQTGNVELFYKLGKEWVSKQFIESKIPGKYNRFGNIVAYSFDGKTLVVGEYQGDLAGQSDIGVVNIFDTVLFK